MINSFLYSGAILSTQDNQVMIGYGKREWMQKPKANTQPTFYFPDFFLRNPASWFQHEEVEEFSAKQLHALLIPPKKQPQPMHHWQLKGGPLYSMMFADLMGAFRRKTLLKAVPYLFYTAQNTPTLPQSLIHLLEHSIKHPTHLYGFWDNARGILGGTPELLFQIDGSGVLTTAAVAGTVPSLDHAQLRADPKLMLEHNLVIEGIFQSLAPFGKVEIGKTEALHLSHISHSKTPIRVQLNGIDQVDSIICALHPTPALGAFPRKEGNRWLAKYNQQLPRERYGAPVGVKIGDHFYCYVGIRNVQWGSSGMRIGVGGGVVEFSKEDSEKRELALKFQAIRSMLNL